MLKDARHCIFRNKKVDSCEQMYDMLEASINHILCHLNIVRAHLIPFVAPQSSVEFCDNCAWLCHLANETLLHERAVAYEASQGNGIQTGHAVPG